MMLMFIGSIMNEELIAFIDDQRINLIGLGDLRLDVSMEYPVAVHVLDRLQQLVDVKLYARLR